MTEVLAAMSHPSIPRVTIREHGNVRSGPDNQLSLRYIEASDRVGYDFFELAWLRLNGDVWERCASLSAAHFQVGASLPRWVSQLHSFDASKRTAIIMVGEIDSPDPHHHKAVYSWRSCKWLDGGFVELELLRVCSDPFEPFTNGS